jgi:hypothetical protein
MGEFLDALKQEAAKRPNANKVDSRLREFLGDAGWKDFEKACKDISITNSVIHRVLKNKGFAVSYSALARVRAEMLES